ncbi:MAG: oligoendopeptidase F [Butyrivibrio sp.]|uniref:oligoendopeptidase F n=1 Tax=Butyrivibrio sp. TaxID=28121 RepID=UPI0025DB4574|nr:oligoendopeptidase F [Butyrivibrio sp.]MCR5773266.1 oligoendopeptidase F [Butyrivibrio sp.]
MEEKKILKREEVPVEYTWNLEDLYKTPADWDKDFENATKLVKEIESFQGHVGESADKLLAWYKKSDEAELLLSALYSYASLSADQDLSNNENQARKGKAVGLLVSISSASAFADTEIMAIEDDKLENFFKENEELTVYRLAIDRVRKKKEHMLSAAEEKLLAASGEMSEGPSNIGSIFRNADLKFPKVKDSKGAEHDLTQGTYISYMESSDREFRKNAFKTFYDTWKSHETLSATIFDAHYKQQTFYANARKYNNNLEAALDHTEVPVSVYHNLIDTVHKHMGSMYRYMDLRKKIMGVDELHMYDLYNSIVPDAEEKITFEQAKEAVFEAIKPLGEDYAKVVKQAYENRWLDVYENEGKRSGAYSSGGARPHPYILLNHKDNLNSQFTLIHETGHTMHSYLSMKNQPVIYSDYVIFVAEVASTCNEVLMMKNLLAKTTDTKKRKYLLNYFMEQFRTTLYRQTMFAEFELKLNELVENGNTLTADTLNKIYYDLNKLYYGDNMVVDEEIASEWARIPHFFYNYYVYQYATGFSAAIALATKILKEGEPAVKNYLKFLSSGSSTDPISLLKIAGVDMSSPAPIDEALDQFDALISEMEKLA